MPFSSSALVRPLWGRKENEVGRRETKRASLCVVVWCKAPTFLASLPFGCPKGAPLGIYWERRGKENEAIYYPLWRLASPKGSALRSAFRQRSAPLGRNICPPSGVSIYYVPFLRSKTPLWGCGSGAAQRARKEGNCNQLPQRGPEGGHILSEGPG